MYILRVLDIAKGDVFSLEYWNYQKAIKHKERIKKRSKKLKLLRFVDNSKLYGG